MSDPTGGRVRINRTIHQLDVLRGKLTAQEFGRAMQQLLACAFEAAGFDVVENAVGVPDFTATPPRPAGNVGQIAVEVKTSDKPEISLTRRDLHGIRTLGQTGMLAVLVFPDLSPRWALVPANSVSARTWKMRHLLAMEQVDVGFDVNDIFYEIGASLDTTSVVGGPELGNWIKVERHKFLSLNSGASTRLLRYL
jgi:hypothetical protein